MQRAAGFPYVRSERLLYWGEDYGIRLAVPLLRSYDLSPLQQRSKASIIITDCFNGCLDYHQRLADIYGSIDSPIIYLQIQYSIHTALSGKKWHISIWMGCAMYIYLQRRHLRDVTTISLAGSSYLPSVSSSEIAPEPTWTPSWPNLCRRSFSVSRWVEMNLVNGELS